jgi:hypothetical protein
MSASEVGNLAGFSDSAANVASIVDACVCPAAERMASRSAPASSASEMPPARASMFQMRSGSFAWNAFSQSLKQIEHKGETAPSAVVVVPNVRITPDEWMKIYKPPPEPKVVIDAEPGGQSGPREITQIEKLESDEAYRKLAPSRWWGPEVGVMLKLE